MSIKITRTGVGTADHTDSLVDLYGSGLLPVQADGDGSTTFRVLGRVSGEAPWVEIRAAGTADFLEAISWVPFIRLEVTAGTGVVSLWVGAD
jgi:hypothetical protein